MLDDLETKLRTTLVIQGVHKDMLPVCEQPVYTPIFFFLSLLLRTVSDCLFNNQTKYSLSQSELFYISVVTYQTEFITDHLSMT